MGVVQGSLLVIGEDLVGLFGRLEADLSLITVIFCDLVWVMCERSLDVLVSDRIYIHSQGSQTLWYAFLISILVAPVVIPRTSILVRTPRKRM